MTTDSWLITFKIQSHLQENSTTLNSVKWSSTSEHTGACRMTTLHYLCSTCHDWQYRGSSMTTDHRLKWPMVAVGIHTLTQTQPTLDAAWMLPKQMVCGGFARHSFYHHNIHLAWPGGKGGGCWLGIGSFAPSFLSLWSGKLMLYMATCLASPNQGG